MQLGVDCSSFLDRVVLALSDREGAWLPHCHTIGFHAIRRHDIEMASGQYFWKRI